jgi:hypothetical protein
MSLDLSSLMAQASPRKPRLPVAEEMLSLRVRDVRTLVAEDSVGVVLLLLQQRWLSGSAGSR